MLKHQQQGLFFTDKNGRIFALLFPDKLEIKGGKNGNKAYYKKKQRRY